jgi:molybdate transport system substrate-binding protein
VNPGRCRQAEYAQQVLRALDLNEKVRDRLIYGANVRQVLDYVIRGEVSAGIVYKTDAIDAGEKVRVMATADPKWHEPIVYPAAVIRSSARRDASKRFLDYLGSDKAMSILQAHGFTPASPASPTSPTSR